jgi:hypothetical protein
MANLNFKRMKYIIIASMLYFVLFTGAAISQPLEVSIRDTTIDRGIRSSICTWFKPYGRIDTYDKLYIEYSFNANVLNIDTLNFKDTNPFVDSVSVEIDLSDLNNAVLKISFDEKGNFGLAGLCLFVEGLAGADTVTMLTPTKIVIDDIEIKDVTFVPGKITVRSSSVIPGITEGLQQNRPNPFSDWTSFPFGLNKDSEISFAVYGAGGRKLLDEDNLTKIFKVQISTEDGEQLSEYKNIVFKRGNYTLSLQPYSWELASGPYFIIMKTESGVYKANFMYIK